MHFEDFSNFKEPKSMLISLKPEGSVTVEIQLLSSDPEDPRVNFDFLYKSINRSSIDLIQVTVSRVCLFFSFLFLFFLFFLL